ncbi:hypothetical protein IJ843_02255 [bacterium]|nr:hypothetical protein [bacterium]
MALTLEQIRQQLNIPKTTSDAEVIRIAQENNIVINFSGNKPADNLPSLNTKSNPSGSVWTAGQNTAAKGSQGGVYGDMGLSLSSSQSTTAASKSIGTVTSSSELSSSLATDNNVTASITQSDITQGAKKKGPKLKDGIDHFTSENGRTIAYDENGKVIFDREARRGEAGYKKVGSGEDVDARLKRFYGLSDEQFENLSPEQKQEKLRSYIAWVRKKPNGDKIAKSDFRRLVTNTGMSPEQARQLGATVYGLSDSDIEAEIQRVADESLYVDEVRDFTTSTIDNADLASDNPELQQRLIQRQGDIARQHGFEQDARGAFTRATVNGKYANRETTSLATLQAYQLDAHGANEDYERYKNDPDITGNMSDDTAAGIADGATRASCDENISEEERNRAAGLATDYPVFIQNSEYQMEVLNNNRDYIKEHGDESAKNSYMNGMASNAYNYDESNRDKIIETVKNEGNQEAQEKLEDARKEYETKQAEEKAAKEAASDEKSTKTNEAEKAENVDNQNAKTNKSSAKTTNAQAQSQTKTSSIVYRTHSTFSSSLASNITRRIMSEDFKNSSKQEKEQFFSSLDVSQRKQAVGALVENSQPYELKNYMHSNMKNSILRYLIYHPTPKNQEALKFLSSDLSTSDKKYIDDVREERLKLIGEANRTQDDKKSENIQPQFTSSQIHNQTQPFASQNGTQRSNGNTETKRNPFLYG